MAEKFVNLDAPALTELSQAAASLQAQGSIPAEFFEQALWEPVQSY